MRSTATRLFLSSSLFFPFNSTTEVTLRVYLQDMKPWERVPFDDSWWSGSQSSHFSPREKTNNSNWQKAVWTPQPIWTWWHRKIPTEDKILVTQSIPIQFTEWVITGPLGSKNYNYRLHFHIVFIYPNLPWSYYLTAVLSVTSYKGYEMLVQT
jgi:hypothetical protein